jgi:hypothetical protein
MAVLEATNRYFREKQRKILPAEEDDDGFVVTPKLLAKLDNIRQQVKNGEYTECLTVDEAINHLAAL